MRSKLGTIELSTTNLTLHHHSRALSFNMLEKLCPRHVLKLLLITNITTKFGTFVQGMFLKIQHCFPNNSSILGLRITLVREFTEIDTVHKNLVDWLQEISSNLAMGTTNILLSLIIHLRLVFLLFSWRHFC